VPFSMSLFGAPAAAATTAGQTNTTGDISKDVTLNQPPEDSISDMRFSPTSEHLAVASWDNKVRIYEISPTGQSEGKAILNADAPVLNCCWSPVGHFWSWSFVSVLAYSKLTLQLFFRMDPKWSVQVQTTWPSSSISVPVLRLPLRNTMVQFAPVICSPTHKAGHRSW